jgi:pyruvate/2-oxoglutarate dehydrogenase complex dihydrolipoamide acyltransferase (E2) component
MPEIRMIKTTPASEDGIHTKSYKAGETYPVSNYLAKLLLDCGTAELVFDDVRKDEVNDVNEAPPASSSQTQKRTRKAVNEAPENAAVNEAPENANAKEKEKPEIVMRVYDLADKLGKSSRQVSGVAKELGIDAAKAASGLTQEQADKIYEKMKKR